MRFCSGASCSSIGWSGEWGKIGERTLFAWSVDYDYSYSWPLFLPLSLNLSLIKFFPGKPYEDT